VRDGKFEFQVLAVTSANAVGDGYMTATAQGVLSSSLYRYGTSAMNRAATTGKTRN
jgi:hypothetical protein